MPGDARGLPSHDKDLPLRDMDVPVRASLLRGLSALITGAGGQGESFLAGYGVDEGEAATSGEAFMSLRVGERILEDVARRFGIPDLGLRMAAQQDLHVLGPLAIAMENSRTVGDAIECASRFLGLLSPALSHAVIPDPLENPGLLGIRYASTTGNASPQALDYGIGMVHRVVTLVSGGPYGLRSVQMPHPRLGPDAAYREYFGAEIAYDCPHAVLRVPRQLMEVPVSGGNDLLRDIALDFLQSRFGHRDVPVSHLVLAVLQGQHGADRSDLAKVARILNLHQRSLQRLLAREGVAFKDLVDRVRRDQTLGLITNTDLPFSQIAVQVGLREQSSLTRAVRRWFGMAPSALRSVGSDGVGDAGE
ncbi:AraC family transcriptional regulator ligand-binding domain-containing protein [Streptomyces sp. NPDC005474]|uniref:AraC family transcriptional regulator n=1 Tax=Streptomyces sp. NPDC005474 TaxID=3154878 RepID=UPI003456615F